MSFIGVQQRHLLVGMEAAGACTAGVWRYLESSSNRGFCKPYLPYLRGWWCVYSYKGYIVKEVRSGKKLCDRSFPLVLGVFGGRQVPHCHRPHSTTVVLKWSIFFSPRKYDQKRQLMGFSSKLLCSITCFFLSVWLEISQSDLLKLHWPKYPNLWVL